jgi:hypothetical protein
LTIVSHPTAWNGQVYRLNRIAGFGFEGLIDVMPGNSSLECGRDLEATEKKPAVGFSSLADWPEPGIWFEFTADNPMHHTRQRLPSGPHDMDKKPPLWRKNRQTLSNDFRVDPSFSWLLSHDASYFDWGHDLCLGVGRIDL